MSTKPADRTTLTGLTHLQEAVMIAAWRRHPKIFYHADSLPHGVYRSLVMLGLLRPRHGGYLLTDEGDHLIRGVARNGSKR